jgi:hypothetical protein
LYETTIRPKIEEASAGLWRVSYGDDGGPEGWYIHKDVLGLELIVATGKAQQRSKRIPGRQKRNNQNR